MLWQRFNPLRFQASEEAIHRAIVPEIAPTTHALVYLVAPKQPVFGQTGLSPRPDIPSADLSRYRLYHHSKPDLVRSRQTGAQANSLFVLMYKQDLRISFRFSIIRFISLRYRFL